MISSRGDAAGQSLLGQLVDAEMTVIKGGAGDAVAELVGGIDGIAVFDGDRGVDANGSEFRCDGLQNAVDAKARRGAVVEGHVD